RRGNDQETERCFPLHSQIGSCSQAPVARFGSSVVQRLVDRPLAGLTGPWLQWRVELKSDDLEITDSLGSTLPPHRAAKHHKDKRNQNQNRPAHAAKRALVQCERKDFWNLGRNADELLATQQPIDAAR